MYSGFKVIIFVTLFRYGCCTVGSDHVCNRICEESKPMTCEYHFTIENYYILSKACHLCPFNRTDCFRPHCVSANGHQRTILTVNRQIPGPSIEVCKGDTVQVWVENKMEDGSSTSIHWHGQTQKHSCHMDGVSMLTQCSIPPFEVFRYEFLAEPAGTHWYHSHTGLQMGEGLFGAFIVRQPKSAECHKDLYSYDSSDHIMIISDWLDITLIERYMKEMHDMFTTDIPLNALVNGRGEKHLVKDEYNLTGSLHTPESAFTPVEIFNVEFGKSYRFRMISAAPRCYFKVSVENHNLLVIATDGAPLEPVSVQSIMIFPGERYDFVLNANKTPSNYWIKLQGMGDCTLNSGHGYAILHYNGYQGNDRPDGNPTDFSTQDGKVLNPLPAEQGLTDVLQNKLRYGGPEETFEDETVDIQYFISLAYLQNDNTRYNNPEYYSVHSLPSVKQHLTPTLNNISLLLPPVPLVTQWNDAKGVSFCNGSSIDTVKDCNNNLCLCTHTLEIEIGQVVEIFMYSFTDDPHPIHLHGQQFRVVGDGMLEPEFRFMSAHDVKEKDQLGKFPRILINPVYKDTITVRGKGSYTIIRFKATNPGIWFFHCHTDEHLMQGMGLFVKIGISEDFPKPPPYFPSCGGYMYQHKNNEQTTSESNKQSSFPIYLIFLAVILLLLLILVLVIVLLVKTFRSSNQSNGYAPIRSS